MKKQKLLLGTKSLKERYEKRLWALILEDTGGAAPATSGEVTKEQVEEAIKKLDKKIEGAEIQSLREQIDSLKQNLQKMESTDSEKYEDKFNDIIDEWLGLISEIPDEDTKTEITAGFNAVAKIGYDFFREDKGTNANKKNEIKEKIQSGIEEVIAILKEKSIEAGSSNEEKETFKVALRQHSPIVAFFKEVFEENDNMPSMEEMLSVVDTLDKKITAIIKAYGTWLKENKEAISEIMEALKEPAAPQTAGYRRLGNTLFERFLMSGGLR